MGNEDKSPSTLLQAVKLQSKTDYTDDDDCPSPTKKQCRAVRSTSGSLGTDLEDGTVAEPVINGTSNDCNKSSTSTSSQPRSNASGNNLRPVSSMKPIAPRPSVLKSQTFTYNMSRPIPATSSSDLSLYPELLSGQIDPEKFLLSHGVDIFNNEGHRQEFITFCERMLTQR